MTDTFISSRYILHNELGSGGMGIVYRATDRLTDNQVALKCVTKPTDALVFNSRSADDDLAVALANEFQALASLRHPNIISVLDFGFSSRVPFFTMSYIEQAQVVTEYGKYAPLQQKFDLLMQLLRALAYLHRRGIVHRDLKPANALVDTNGQLRVLDFGLAEENPAAAVDGRVAGTLACIAPEVLQGAAPTVRADLYAVGLIAYEIFSHKYPYATDNPSNLVTDIIQTEPSYDDIDLPEDTVNIIRRLLLKNPNDRYASAEDVIKALQQTSPITLDDNDTDTRESYLQAARFVGRDDELSTLVEALDNSVDGIGSTWLIGGESGVGKSRLLTELNIRAQVKGALMLMGQGVSGGGLPFQLWRDPVRYMALEVEMSDLDASVLKEIAPDLPRLLGRDIPDAPHVDSEANQKRIISSLVSIFQTINRPVVLMVEDLHWMDESLNILKQLNPIVSDLRALIVGTYRSDERADLPDEMPHMNHIHLERLSEQEIAALSQSMLGDAGCEPQVLDLLQKETEGNVFFIVETVRALAEEAGRLSNIGRLTLPPTVFAGGVQQVVERRLNRLPAHYRPLLDAAAVAGRQLDVQLIDALKGDDIDIDSWFLAGLNSALFDVKDNQWRFAHDKLREGVLSTLSDEQFAELSRQVAETLEQIYPDNEAHAKVLADHWHNADDADREAIYAFQTGKLLRDTQVHTARIYLQRAKELFSKDDPHYNECLWLLARIDMKMSSYDLANTLIEESIALAQQRNDQPQLAETLLVQSDMQNRLSQFDEAKVSCLQALAYANATDDKRLIALCLNKYGGLLVEESKYDTAQRYFEDSLSIADGIEDYLTIAAFNYNNMGMLAYRRGQAEQAMRYFQQTLDIRQQAGTRHSIAASLNNIGVIAASIGKFEEARDNHERSMQIKREMGDRFGMSNSLTNMGVAALHMQDYQLAEQYFRDALDLSRAVNNGQGIADNLNNVGLVLLKHNHAYDEALEMLLQAAEESLAVRDRLGYALALTNAGDALLMLNRVPEAIEKLQAGITEANDIKAMQPLLRGIMWMSKVVELRGNPQQTVTYYSFVNLHPSADEETRRDSEQLLLDLSNKMSASELANAIEASKTFALDEVVETMLAIESS